MIPAITGASKNPIIGKGGGQRVSGQATSMLEEQFVRHRDELYLSSPNPGCLIPGISEFLRCFFVQRQTFC